MGRIVLCIGGLGLTVKMYAPKPHTNLILHNSDSRDSACPEEEMAERVPPGPEPYHSTQG